MNITVKELDTYYEIHGAGEQSLLFLHGWGAPVATYAPIFQHLAGKYRVIAVDMPGCGKTAQPVAPLSVEDYKAFILDFCRQIGLENAVIMCHSHGGRVAAAIMSERYSKLGCSKAVFMDTAGIVPRRSALYRLRQGGYKLLKLLGTFALTKPFFYELYEVARDRRSSADYRLASEVMKKTLSRVVNTDMTPHLSKIEAEVLLIWGEKDTATPLAQGEQMEKLIKNCGLAVIKNAGHFPFIDSPAAFYAVLDAFL